MSKASADCVRPSMARIGTLVVGRHVFDMTNGWEGVPPAGEQLVVVSHRPRPRGGAGPRQGRGDRVLHLRYRVRKQP